MSYSVGSEFGVAPQKSNNSGGLGILPIIFLIFLVLKLTGLIHWSWWWVTFPLWLPFAVIGFFIALAVVAVIIIGIFS
jgi:hypothetical protein